MRIHFTLKTLFPLDIFAFLHKFASLSLAVQQATARLQWGCVLALLQGLESVAVALCSD